MKKVDQLIQETQVQIQQVRQQGAQLEEGIKQAQQQFQQIVVQHDALVARLNTLQEVAGMGDTFLAEVPVEGALEETRETVSEETKELKV